MKVIWFQIGELKKVFSNLYFMTVTLLPQIKSKSQYDIWQAFQRLLTFAPLSRQKDWQSLFKARKKLNTCDYVTESCSVNKNGVFL